MMQAQQRGSADRYTYASEPHAVPVKRNKPKYRDTSSPQLDQSLPNSPPMGLDTASGHGGSGYNIMNDPRVIRGNTYATRTSAVTTPVFEPNLPLPPSAGSGGGQRDSTPNSKDLKKVMKSSRNIPGKHRSSAHRQPIVLEELVDRPIEIDIDPNIASNGMNHHHNRPKSPLFVTNSNGKDVATQIEKGDLFDFDIEVEPLLEVLVGKTIHVSILELIQEEEFEQITKKQQQFELIRNIELSELQRLQREINRKKEEKQHRQQQSLARKLKKEELEETVAARELSRNYLLNVHEEVLKELQDEGCIYDPIKREIEENIIGDLLQGMRGRVGQYELARELMEQLMVDAWDKAMEYQERGEKAREVKRERERREAEEAARLKALEEERKRKELEEAARKAEQEENGGGGEEES